MNAMRHIDNQEVYAQLGMLLKDRARHSSAQPKAMPEIYRPADSAHAGSGRFFMVTRVGAGHFWATLGENDFLIAFSQADMDVHTNVEREKRQVLTAFKNVHGVILPPSSSCDIASNDGLYVFYGSTRKGVNESVSFVDPGVYSPEENRAGKLGSIRGAVVFKNEVLHDHIRRYGNAKIMVPNHWNGWIKVEEGSLGNDSKGRKEITIGPADYDFSAGNALSPQDFHVHDNLHEIFVTLSGMWLFYQDRDSLKRVHAEKGDTVIVPPGVPHISFMEGKEPTYVFKASLRDGIALDKKVLLGTSEVESLTALFRG